MALREIRKIGDEILRKKCRKVDKVDDRIITLLDDMADTMYEANGVGLAAPQVGVLKRIFVMDAGEPYGLLKMINPEIIESRDIQINDEGCLSIPGVNGDVIRPKWLKVKATNEKGEEVIYEGEDLFAKAVSHEIDHLDGILFVDKIEEKEQV